jgi:hypothetical protein
MRKFLYTAWLTAAAVLTEGDLNYGVPLLDERDRPITEDFFMKKP